jgi:ribosomal protein S18 acetylase RimI-like enzyme
MKLRFSTALQSDAPEMATLHTAANEDLTQRFGQGPWSSIATEKGVLFAIRNKHMLVARKGKRIVGTLILQSKKPWAIDVSYFTPVKKTLYLTGMAVIPAMQKQGIGRALLEEATKIARKWPADAIRLDAWDANAGAGPFYAKCGYRKVAHALYKNNPLIYLELVL